MRIIPRLAGAAMVLAAMAQNASSTKTLGVEAGIGRGLTGSTDHWVVKLIVSKDL